MDLTSGFPPKAYPDISAAVVAEQLITFFLFLWIPKSDQGSDFMSELMQNIFIQDEYKTAEVDSLSSRDPGSFRVVPSDLKVND